MSINLLSGQELFIQNTDKLKGSVKIMGKNYTTVYDSTTHRYRYFDESGMIAIYNKMHLVPGAEYVPFSKYLNSLEYQNKFQLNLQQQLSP